MSEDKPIIVEQSYNVSPSKLWQAITVRDEMVEWFFQEIPDFKPEVGFKTQFNINNGERDFLHLWTITEAVPEQKLVYDWRYQGMPGIGKVTFEISPDGDGSRLTLTNEGLESFPKDVPEFSAESCVAGWEYFLQGNLKDYLDGESMNH